MALTQDQLDILRLRLVEEKRKLESTLFGLRRDNPSNDEDRVNDNADVGTDAMESLELDRHDSLEHETTILLDRVNQALERMDGGSYGVTNEGVEIPFARLQVDPTVTSTLS